MHKRLRSLLAGILVLGVLMTVSCAPKPQTYAADEEAITQVMTSFVYAYQHNQYNLCLDYCSTRLRNDVGDKTLIGRMQRSREFTSDTVIERIGNPSVNGGRANVYIYTTGISGVPSVVKYSLTKEGGKWKIDGLR